MVAVPKRVERKLKATARRRGYGVERTRRYVYGTMAKLKRRRGR